MGLRFSPKQLFQYQTIAELAAVAQPGDQTPVSQLPAAGKVLLTPIQKWFFEQDLAVPEHFNQSVCLELPNGFSPEALAAAIAHIYHHHDALRLRFTPTNEGWQQTFSDRATPPAIDWFDFSQVPALEQDRAIAQKIQALQTSLNLQHGPLVNIGVFALGNARLSQLFIAIHHLVIDGVSWRILLTDLQQVYQQAVAGEAIQLAQKTHSYQQWAQELAQTANSPEAEADFDYWQAIAHSQPGKIPQDAAGEENVIGSSQTIITALSAELTRSLLHEVPPVYNTQITEVLLTALAQTLAQWTGDTTALIDLESYGRFSDTLTLARTVGWFTALYPVPLSFDATQPLGNNLKAMKAQLRAVPNQGISYGLLRYMNRQYSSQTQALAIVPSISFNYLGQLDAIKKGEFRRGRVPDQTLTSAQSANQAAANRRPHLIDINSWVEKEQLRIQWIFSRHHHTTETIEQLAKQFIFNLSALIEHCCAKESVEYAPDDFALAQLDQSALEAVMSQVSFATADSAEQAVTK